MLTGNSQNDSMVPAAVTLQMPNHSAAFESEAFPHLNDLYRTALQMLHQSAKASAAVERTYLRAWTAVGKYQPDMNCKARLFQILIDVVRHEHRSSVRRRGQAALPEGSDAPKNGAFAMNLVPADLMEVLLLVDGQGFSYRVAAEILGLSTDVVARRVVVGRNHLHSAQEDGTKII